MQIQVCFLPLGTFLKPARCLYTSIGAEYPYNNALVLLWKMAKIRPRVRGLRTFATCSHLPDKRLILENESVNLCLTSAAYKYLKKAYDY